MSSRRHTPKYISECLRVDEAQARALEKAKDFAHYLRRLEKYLRREFRDYGSEP